MKETVQHYNEIMKKASDLKKQKKLKEKNFNTVVSFFENTDDNYLTKMFPLFQGTGSDGLLFTGPVKEGEFAKAEGATIERLGETGTICVNI